MSMIQFIKFTFQRHGSWTNWGNLKSDVVDSDKIQAKYEGGVLHLTIPKKEEAKKKRQG
ncbi:MAG: Hsp20 family protein [Ginsengibacter sp.]